MTIKELAGIKLPPVEQVGIVVNNVDQAIERFGSVFGWGPFNVSEVELQGSLYRGQPTDCKLRMAFSQETNPIEIELIENLEGETLYTEFLKKHGEGIHHLRYTVDDLDGKLAKMKKHGVEPIWSHSYPELGISFVYMDTEKVCGVMLELLEVKEVQP